VQKADYLPLPDVPEDSHPAPIAFSHLELDLPTGQDIGEIGTQAAPFPCMWPYKPLRRKALADSLSGTGNRDDDLKRIFHDTLAGEGYDITGTLDFDFKEDDDDPDLRAEYKVGGKVRRAEIFACRKEPNTLQWAFGMRYGYKGEVFIAVDWSLYDALKRAIVYRKRTEGYSKRRVSDDEGIALMFNEAFEMAASNLGADPQFHDLVFNGKKPANDGDPARERAESRPRMYDALEEVRIENPPLSQKPFPANAAQARKIAVLVQGGVGYGSGFFIDNDGHILTASHVVGEALRVRVVTADREEKLTAEVIRRDVARDVALLRLETKQPAHIAPQPIRPEIPAVSEPVYAIGTLSAGTPPRKLQDTVKSGIVSAWRPDFKIPGSRQNFIQADIPVTSGYSGGPLLDANGNILGLALGSGVTGGGDIGLHMFIPIAEALESLKITLGSAAPQLLTAKK
jgi:S1-C subfamily serine protease